MSAVEAAALADQLAGCVQHLDPVEQRAQLTLFRLLADGAPVPAARLAAETGRPEAEIARSFERWHGVRTADGAVVAFQGLSLAKTPHRFRVGGRELYTWCAWDTLFLPEVLGRRAEVESACPTTGATISLCVDRDGPRDVAPASTVMSFRPASPVFVDEVQESFCRYVHFFRSAAHAEPWVAEHPGTIVISLAEGFEIGRRTNAAQFGCALRGS
jgi:alkylmercury lyase